MNDTQDKVGREDVSLLAFKFGQERRDTAAITEDTVQFPAFSWWLTIICDSSSRKFNTFLWPTHTLGRHFAYKHVCRQNTH